MSEDSIHVLAERLSSVLDAGSEVSEQDRTALRSLLVSIASTLDRSSEGETPADDEHHHDLLDRLRGQTLKLEREHPDLVALVDRIARALSNAGI